MNRSLFVKRIPLFLALVVWGFLVSGAGCASDPNVEGAKLDIRNKDYDRAIENLNTALEKDPQNAEAWKLKGIVLQEQLANVQDRARHGQMVRDMVDAFAKAIEYDEGEREEVVQRMRLGWYNEYQRGVQAFNRGAQDKAAFTEAAEYFRLASLIQPDSIPNYVNEGLALIAGGQPAEAVTPLEKAIELGDDSPDTYLYLGQLYVDAQRGEDAVRLLEGARQKFPDNEDIATTLLNAYVGANQLDRALEVYAAEVQRSPDNKLYRYNYGSLLLNSERYDEAIEQLGEAVRLDPEYSTALYNLGAAYTNKAVQINEQTSQLDDQLKNAQTAQERQTIQQQIDQLSSQRRDLFNQAIPHLEKGRSIVQGKGEDPADFCRALFQAYAQTGEEEKAREAAQCAGIDLN